MIDFWTFDWLEDWKREVYYWDLYTAFTGDKYNIFAWLGDAMADHMLVQPGANYTREPVSVPHDGWWTIFRGVYEVYYKMYIYTF